MKDKIMPHPDSYSGINLKELNRLPEDFPNLKEMKEIWSVGNSRDTKITNSHYAARLKQQVKEKVDRYFENYERNMLSKV